MDRGSFKANFGKKEIVFEDFAIIDLEGAFIVIFLTAIEVLKQSRNLAMEDGLASELADEAQGPIIIFVTVEGEDHFQQAGLYLFSFRLES